MPKLFLPRAKDEDYVIVEQNGKLISIRVQDVYAENLNDKWVWVYNKDATEGLRDAFYDMHILMNLTTREIFEHIPIEDLAPWITIEN